MKKLLLVVFVFGFTHLAISQNVLTDDFDYPPVDSLENSGNWYRSGANLPYNIKVVEPGLIYPGYAGSGIGNSSLLENAGEGDILINRFSSSFTSGNAYMSFMFRIEHLPASVTQGYCIGFDLEGGPTDINTQLVINRISDNEFKLGTRKIGGFAAEFSTKTYRVDQTYLIVLKYSFIPGMDNDISELFVFEQGVPSAEPAQSLAATSSGYDLDNQGEVSLLNNYAQTGLSGISAKIDGIRVGNSWETSVLHRLTIITDPDYTNNNKLIIYPNPSENLSVIQFSTPISGQVNIEILDYTGKQILNLINEYMNAGDHEISVLTAVLPKGIYICDFQLNNKSIEQKRFVVK